jgi:hypothetical protein
VTRTYYLSAVAGPWDGMHTGTLSLEQLPVWSVVEQTIEVTPDGGRASSRVLRSGLMLDEAHRCLNELLVAVIVPSPFSAVRLGDDPSSGSGQAVDTCLIIYHRHHHEE